MSFRVNCIAISEILTLVRDRLVMNSEKEESIFMQYNHLGIFVFHFKTKSYFNGHILDIVGGFIT